MKIISFAIILLLISCEKQDSSFVTPSGSDIHKLEMIVKTIDYANPENEVTIPVVANQSMDYNYRVLDIHSTNRFFWFLPWDNEPNENELDVLVTIQYNVVSELELPSNKLDIEFVFRESKDKLLQLTDSTFVYKDLHDLATILEEEDWGNTGWNMNKSQLLLTAPEEVDMSGMHFSYSSTGNYYEDEVATIKRVNFDEQSNTLQIWGDFSFYIKVMSCGFYNIHHIKSATFSAEIH